MKKTTVDIIRDKVKETKDDLKHVHPNFAENSFEHWYEYDFKQDPTAVLEKYPLNVFKEVMFKPDTFQILQLFEENSYTFAYWKYESNKMCKETFKSRKKKSLCKTKKVLRQKRSLN